MSEPPRLPPAVSAPTEPHVVRFDVSFATIAKVMVAVAGVWLLGQLIPVVLVLVGALFIGGTLGPVIEWFEAKKVRRGVAIALVFGALVLATMLIIVLTIPALLDQVKNLQAGEPEWRARAVAWLRRSSLTAPLASALRDLRLAKWVSLSVDNAIEVSTRIGEFLAYSMAAIFLALYGLIDRDRLRGILFALVPRAQHMRLSRIMLNLETIVGGYIRGQVITSALMAVFMFILLAACGVPNALALAVFGGAADVLPYIGPLLTIVPAVVASLGQGPVIVSVVLILLLAYEEFESRFLIPVVYGRALRLPSTVVMFALLVGTTLMGVLGALLALPVAAALVMLAEELGFELPGEPVSDAGNERRENDNRGDSLYADLTQGMPAAQAAAIAAELSDERKKDEAGAGDEPAAVTPARTASPT